MGKISDTLHVVHNGRVVSTMSSASNEGGNTLLIFGELLSESVKEIFRQYPKDSKIDSTTDQ